MYIRWVQAFPMSTIFNVACLESCGCGCFGLHGSPIPAEKRDCTGTLSVLLSFLTRARAGWKEASCHYRDHDDRGYMDMIPVALSRKDTVFSRMFDTQDPCYGQWRNERPMTSLRECAEDLHIPVKTCETVISVSTLCAIQCTYTA